MKQPEDNMTPDFMDILLHDDGSWSYWYESPLNNSVIGVYRVGTENYEQFLKFKLKDKRNATT